jgi:hypothetical protein
LTDLSRFEEFFAQVLQTGVSAGNSVKFETSKLRENKDKARERAMKSAKEKATAMAAAVGQTIGRAIKITEGNDGGQTFPNYSANSNTIGTAGVFSEGFGDICSWRNQDRGAGDSEFSAQLDRNSEWVDLFGRSKRGSTVSLFLSCANICVVSWHINIRRLRSRTPSSHSQALDVRPQPTLQR